MSHRCLTSRGVLAMVIGGVLLLAPAHGAGQTASPAAKSATSAKPWTSSRTADGQPDLQGVWSNDTITPLERPAEYAGKAFLTDEELKAAEKALETVNTGRDSKEYRDRARDAGLDVSGAYNAFWRRESDKPLNRTSLITDPPDGKAPPISEAATRRFAEYSRARGYTGSAAKAELNVPSRNNPIGLGKKGGVQDGVQGGVDGRGNRADNPEDRHLGERCLTRGLIRLPGGNNPNFEIVQGAGYVAIRAEMGNEVRIIPLDGRPHIPSNVRQWLGDSRGRWDGNTLVIETTNVNDKAPWKGSFEGLHVTERLTRVGEDTINYEVTVEDPATWPRPWTFAFPLTNLRAHATTANKYEVPQIFEYACHEGNYSMFGMLSGARAQERAAAAAKPEQK